MYGFLLCFMLCLMIIMLHFLPKSALENQEKEVFLLINLKSDESAEMQIRCAVDMLKKMEKRTGGIVAIDTGLTEEGRNICKTFCSEIAGLYLVQQEELPNFLKSAAE